MKGTNIREIRSWDGIVDADDGFAGSSSLRKACTNDAKETAAAESLKKKRCRSSRFSVNTDRSSYSIIRLGQSPVHHSAKYRHMYNAMPVWLETRRRCLTGKPLTRRGLAISDHDALGLLMPLCDAIQSLCYTWSGAPVTSRILETFKPLAQIDKLE